MDKKPVVPKFVADWYEESKGYFEYNLCNLCVDFHERKLQEDLHEWFTFEDKIRYGKAHLLTEKEIKQKDERLWQFRKEVEE